MVAMAVAGLAAAGRFRWDDPAAGHVPELSASRAGRAGPRSATCWPTVWGCRWPPLRSSAFAGQMEQDDHALSRLVAEAATAGPAGDFWSYTNVGWCVLGRVIETAAAAGWEDAMRSHLLRRAGMADTAFVTSGTMEGRVTGHEVTPAGPVPVAPLTTRAYGPAGTTAVTTVADLLRFAALHLAEPSPVGASAGGLMRSRHMRRVDQLSRVESPVLVCTGAAEEIARVCRRA